MVRESLEPGQSVSVVARRNGINPNQLFHWRKLYQDGSLLAVSAADPPESNIGSSPSSKRVIVPKATMYDLADAFNRMLDPMDPKPKRPR